MEEVMAAAVLTSAINSVSDTGGGADLRKRLNSVGVTKNEYV